MNTPGVIYGKDKKVDGWWAIPSLEVAIRDYKYALFYIQKKYDEHINKGEKVWNEDALKNLGVKLKKNPKTNLQKKFDI